MRIRCAFVLALALVVAGSGTLQTAGATQGERDRTRTDRWLWGALLEPGDTPFDLAVSPDGTRVYVAGCTGQTACGGGGKMTTVAYGVATGRRLWTAQYQQIEGEAFGVSVSPDGGRVYVTGYARFSFDDYADYVTLAYDASTGDQVWAARYNAADDTDIAWRVAASPDGTKVFVTGESWIDRTSFDFATIAYDAATGDELWVTRYDGLYGGYDIPHGLGVSPDGSLVFVTGESPGSYGFDFATVAYDAATGAQAWVSRYNDPEKQGDTPYDLVVAPDGSRVYVTGCAGIWDYCVEGDFLTLAYDAPTGTLAWSATTGSPGLDFAKSVGVSPDGTLVYVAGWWEPQDDSDFSTVAYDAVTGAEVWQSIYASTGVRDDYVCCLAVGGTPPRVVVTGSSSLEYGPVTFSTVGYDGTTGAQVWVQHFNGRPAYNYPQAIGMTSNGALAFVTGSIIGPDGGYDWMTIAYRT